MSQIPQLPWEQVKRKTTDEIKAFPCVELLDDEGVYIGTLMVPMSDYVRLNCDFKGAMSNAVHPSQGMLPVEEDAVGALPKPLVATMPRPVLGHSCPDCGFATTSRIGPIAHIRKHKRDAEKGSALVSV